LKKLECYKIDVDRLIESSKNHPDEEELKSNLSSLNKKLSSLTLRTEHQILVTKRAKNHHEKNQANVDKYKNSLMEIEEWLKITILSVERLNTQPNNETEAQERINKLEEILKELEDKEAEVKKIHDDCENLDGFNDIQKFVKELLLGLSSNIQVIRENQRIIRENLLKAKDQPKEIIEVIEKVETTPSNVESLPVKQQEIVPAMDEIDNKVIETSVMSTQTINEPSIDNIMVIQSMSSEGETIQIYNTQSNPNDASSSTDKNVIVEAKYVRDHDDQRKSSELILKNVPKQFETTFVEPDETTTEIIVDPDGSKRIIVRKLTKNTTQIVATHEELDTGSLPEHIRSQLTQSGVTHDVIMGTSGEQGFEPISNDVEKSTIHAVIEPVTNRVIRKTRQQVIKKVVIIDGVEQITEEIIDEPEDEITEKPIEEEISAPEIVEIIEPSKEVVPEPTEISIEEVPKSEPEVVEQEIVKEETVVQEVSKEVSQPIEEGVKSEISEEKQEQQVIEDSLPEGENDTQQVFDKITDAHVDDLTVTEVDNSAPVEDIKEIWPAYEMPITNTTTSQSNPPSVVDEALAELDEKSHEIWPQNLATGSNVALETYHFESTVEKIELNIDESPVDVNLELKEEPKSEVIEPVEIKVIEEDQKLEIVNQSEEAKEPEIETIESQPEINEKVEDEKEPEIEKIDQPETIIEEIRTEETLKEEVEPKIESKTADEIETVPEISVEQTQPTVDTKSPSDENVSVVEEIEKVFEKSDSLQSPEATISPPKSPISRPMSPQKATITIVKTMTFLEQEKINSQATMIVRTELADELDASQADRSLTESVLNTSEMHKEIEPENIVSFIFLLEKFTFSTFLNFF
jgi:hypothetical protein